MPITRENIIKKLELLYPNYTFETRNIIKNGDVCLQAILFRDDSPIAPTIYIDSIINYASSLDHAVSIICQIIENNINPGFDITLLSNKTYVLEHLRIGVQKSSNEDIPKTHLKLFPGMEAYLFITDQLEDKSSWSVKVQKNQLETLGISESYAWELAKANTAEATVILPLYETLSRFMESGEYMDFEMQSHLEMYIITNKEKYKGAGSIINQNTLVKFAKQHHCSSIVVLPSSIHECLLIPIATDNYTDMDFNTMVQEVNRTYVAPTEQLVNRAYVLNLFTE